jgi:hypothetical protein
LSQRVGLMINGISKNGTNLFISQILYKLSH